MIAYRRFTKELCPITAYCEFALVRFRVSRDLSNDFGFSTVNSRRNFPASRFVTDRAGGRVPTAIEVPSLLSSAGKERFRYVAGHLRKSEFGSFFGVKNWDSFSADRQFMKTGTQIIVPE